MPAPLFSAWHPGTLCQVNVDRRQTLVAHRRELDTEDCDVSEPLVTEYVPAVLFYSFGEQTGQLRYVERVMPQLLDLREAEHVRVEPPVVGELRNLDFVPASSRCERVSADEIDLLYRLDVAEETGCLYAADSILVRLTQGEAGLVSELGSNSPHRLSRCHDLVGGRRLVVLDVLAERGASRRRADESECGAAEVGLAWLASSICWRIVESHAVPNLKLHIRDSNPRDTGARPGIRVWARSASASVHCGASSVKRWHAPGVGRAGWWKCPDPVRIPVAHG